MTAPTRTRRFGASPSPADKPSVLQDATSGVAATPPASRSYVIRNAVDRRSHDRRSGPRRGSEARSIAQPDPEELLSLDPTLRAYFDSAISCAREDAYREGHTEGRREALAGSSNVAAAIAEAADGISHFSRTERKLATEAVLELAERLATEIINRTPHDAGAATLRRIREVLEDLKDEPLAIAVNADDLDIISAGLNGAEVTVAVDPHLKPGEARIRGAWSYSDLTRDAAWEAIRTALANDDDLLQPEPHQPE